MATNRKLFEDVTVKPAQPVAVKGAIDAGRKGARNSIRNWLISLFLLVFAMILIGGATRLTDSGLSITEWRPLTGSIPPLNAADWASEFAKYQAIDQFRLQHQWMTLADFKEIYWWEWGHRQLGRVIGLVWAVGFFWFLLRRQIPVGWTPRLLLLGALGGLQGAIGWWMVSSGVTTGTTITTVASTRLATHLGLAFIIMGLITWFALSLGRKERDLMQARRTKETKLYGLSTGLMHFIFLQILIGALVAGIDAGRTYTDWPLMAGQFFPPQAFVLTPVWTNFIENPGLVQFIHRMTGYVLFAFAIVVWLRGRKSAHARTRFAFNAVMLAVTAQVVLGIGTVLVAAILPVALAHQGLAVLCWVLIIRARHLSLYPIATSLRGATA
jgi:cytochrome c oxidase assembly protein subunit 15